jgi:hypothetical protein
MLGTTFWILIPNDGVLDVVEASTNPLNPRRASGLDSNSNGWDDTFEPLLGGTPLQPLDRDSDGMADFMDLDSDNDGLRDYIELSPNPAIPRTLRNTDSDCDGVDDVFISALNTLKDTDRDGVPDHLDLDSDNDGISDTVESWADP